MLRRFVVYFHDCKRDLIGGFVCVIFETVFELVIPAIMASLIDVGVVRRDMGDIIRKSLLMVACALVSLFLGALYARLAARAGQGFGAALREAEYRNVQGFSFANMDHFNTSSLITRLTNDITVLQNTISNGFRPFVRAPVMLVMALGMSIVMSPRLAVVFLVAIPTLAACLYLILRRLGPMYGIMQRALDRLNLIVQENLAAIRTVKSYGKEASECRKFDGVNGSFRDASQRAFHYATMNMPCFQLIMYATIVCILWFGGNFIRAGTMQIGELTGFLSYVLQILNSLMMLSNVFLMLSRSVTSASRIAEVLDEKPDIADGDGGWKVERGEIDFDHVSFKYRQSAREPVLSDICLHISAGQTVGIIGGTGSAKSSLVQLIPRLYDVSSGSLKIDGHDVREYPVAPLRDAVGMVLQKNTLFSGTIRENLRWGDPNATDEELDRACHIACVDEFLPRMPRGYDTDLEEGGVNLSGGQKQRLCIARALLKRPRVLILDDSTSAVDTATEAKICRRLARELRDTTKIIITQRIGEVRDADLIVVMQDGRIGDAGTHEELLGRSQVYRDIYEFQQKGADERKCQDSLCTKNRKTCTAR